MKNLSLFVCGLLCFFMGACVGSTEPRNPMKKLVEVAPVTTTVVVKATIAPVDTSVFNEYDRETLRMLQDAYKMMEELERQEEQRYPDFSKPI